MNILKSLINYWKKKKEATNISLSIYIVPEPFEDDEELEIDDMLLCQACLEENAIACCPNCGCPLCFDCYIEHVKEPKEKLPN